MIPIYKVEWYMSMEFEKGFFIIMKSDEKFTDV